MAWMALALVLLLAGALLTLARRRTPEGPTADWVVEPVRLLAPAEQELHAQLRAAFPQHLVLAQVSLARLVRMRRSRGSMRVFQPYLRMAAPFVVCSREFMPLIVVDVYATTDVPRPTREQRKRAAVVQASGLVHLTVCAVGGAVPTADELRERVRTALQAKGPRAAGAAPGRVAPARAASPRVVPRAPAVASPASGSLAPGRFPALVGGRALGGSLAAATASVRRLVRPLLARAPAAAPVRRAKVA
jgi:hypothetical protein